MDAHKTVLLEALAGLSELDFPMQDILELQLQVVLLRRKAVAQEIPKQSQPELKAITKQQNNHLDECEAHFSNALDSFNTYLLGFLAARGCERLRKELGGPKEQQTWDQWLDSIPQKQLAALKMPPDTKDLLKMSGYASYQKPSKEIENVQRNT